jgi:hypothetical protein
MCPLRPDQQRIAGTVNGMLVAGTARGRPCLELGPPEPRSRALSSGGQLAHNKVRARPASAPSPGLTAAERLNRSRMEQQKTPRPLHRMSGRRYDSRPFDETALAKRFPRQALPPCKKFFAKGC